MTIDVAPRRPPVFARRAMVASAHPLASVTGVEVLRDGGNAMDAGLAMAAMLTVVDPAMTGIGGDACLLYYDAPSRRLTALNGTGRAPRAASIDRYRALGCATMPLFGPLTITVPGAVDAWCAAAERHGRRPLGALLAPAIAAAEQGVPVGRALAAQWRSVGSKRMPADPDAMRAYTVDGRFPDPGEVLRLTDLARTLAAVAEGGGRVLSWRDRPRPRPVGPRERRVARAGGPRGAPVGVGGAGARAIFWMYAAVGAEVEVDPETGQVTVTRMAAAADAGKAINPLNCIQQIEGSAIMGLGMAVMEEVAFDGGRTLNPTFLDYKLPTTLDAPDTDIIIVESGHAEGPYGAKGIGESAIAPVPAAVGNAVYDAVGVQVKDLPIRAEKVHRALRAGARS